MQDDLKTEKICKCVHVHIVLSVFIQKKCSFASDWSSSGCGHVGSLFTNIEQKKVGSWCV